MFHSKFGVILQRGAICFSLIVFIGCEENNKKRQNTKFSRAAPTLDWDPSSLRYWLPENPPWFQRLSPNQRKKLKRAERMVKQGHDYWGASRLDEAEHLLMKAGDIYNELLGKDHWKTWDTALDLHWIKVERRWIDTDEWKLGGLKGKHMDFAHELLVRAKHNQPDEAEERVNRLCDFWKNDIKEEYRPFLYGCQQWGLGIVALSRKQPDIAQRHIEEALKYLAEACPQNHPFMAVVSNEMAIGLLKNHFGGADRWIHMSLKILKDGLPVRDMLSKIWLHTLYLKSLSSVIKGKHGAAKVASMAAVAISWRGQHRDPYVLLYSAALNNYVFDYGAARKNLHAMRDYVNYMEEKNLEPDLVTLWHQEMGITSLGLGELLEAIKHCQTVLTRGCFTSEHRKCARAHHFCGLAFSKVEQPEEAIKQFDFAAKSFGNTKMKAVTQFCRIRAQTAMNVRNEKLQQLSWRRNEAEKVNVLDDIGNCRRFRLIARIDALQKKNVEADKACDVAIHYYQRARPEEFANPVDLAYWHENESPYLLAAMIRLRLDDKLKAFELHERHTAQALNGFLNNEIARYGNNRLFDIVMERLGQPRRGKLLINSATMKEVLRERNIGRQRDQALSRPQSIGEIIDGPLLRDEKTAIVGWLIETVRPDTLCLPDSWAFVVRQSGCKWIPLNGIDHATAEEIEQLSNELTVSITNADPDWMQKAYQIYRKRFKPVMPYLEDVSRLYVLNRGAMREIPMEALPMKNPEDGQPQKYLGDRFTIAYGPSCSALSKLSMRESSNGSSILAFGNPKTDRSPLPMAEVAARAIARYFDFSKIKTGPTASEAYLYQLDVLDKLQDFSYVHYAGHATSDSVSPDACRLHLARPQDTFNLASLMQSKPGFNDGELTFREIQNLSLRARLVVLSGCDSGGGRPLESEGYLGLPQAFLAAGARAVIVTLWPVNDLAAAILMERFYSKLTTESMDEAEALQAAKQEIRRMTWNDVIAWCKNNDVPDLVDKLFKNDDLPYAHPKYWSGYILIGPQN